MLIVDPNILESIKYILNKKTNENITEEDLLNVEEINLNNKTFSGKEKNINLKEIENLVNLKSIYIQYFSIDDNVIDILNSLKKLLAVRFSSCKFINTRMLDNGNIKNISIEYSDIKDYTKVSCAENIKILGEEKLRIDDLMNKNRVENLYINNSKIKNFENIKDFTNLKKLNIDGSKVDNKKILDALEGKVIISKKEKYLPIG